MNWFYTNWVELVGALLGVVFVILEIKENSLLWPIGIATSVFYIVVFFNAKFYADMSLQFFYIAISIYGWYIWKFKPRNELGELQISSIPQKTILQLLIILIVSCFGIGYLMKTYTDAVVPYWDALTTVLSVIATWMLAKKYIEQWLVWIVTNGICIGLYMYKDLHVTVILFCVYFAMSIVGYMQWLKTLQLQQK